MWARNIAEIFKSSQSEEEVEGEEALMYLARRYKGLTVNACAHAIFFCRLLHALRPSKTEKAFPASLADSCGLKVGIIGGGHLGKQLAQVLLTPSCAPCCSIRISTRRPESLAELQEQGVGCFYDNAQLVAWADVVFLCCLPSQVLTVCSVIRPAIRKPCVVYSLVTAVPLRRPFLDFVPINLKMWSEDIKRKKESKSSKSKTTLALKIPSCQGLKSSLLKQLLSYSAIVRPQYQCCDREPINEWRTKGTVTAALQDPAVVQATCPCSSQGKIRVNTKWLVASFYAALNSSMWQRLPHEEALKLLNDLCFPERCPICAEAKTSCPRFVCQSFVSKTFASSMTQEETFPWFDLTAAQLRESPFSQLLEGSEAVQSHLARLYQAAFGAWPAEQRGLASTDTSPTSAAVEPGVMVNHKTLFSTTASEISSKKLEETTDNDSKFS